MSVARAGVVAAVTITVTVVADPIIVSLGAINHKATTSVLLCMTMIQSVRAFEGAVGQQVLCRSRRWSTGVYCVSASGTAKNASRRIVH